MYLIHVNRVFMFSIIWLSVDSFVHRKCFVTIQKISFKELLLRQIPNATILFLSFSFFNLKKNTTVPVMNALTLPKNIILSSITVIQLVNVKE